MGKAQFFCVKWLKQLQILFQSKQSEKNQLAGNGPPELGGVEW
jgi:hypothetical protein